MLQVMLQGASDTFTASMVVLTSEQDPVAYSALVVTIVSPLCR